jgi:guanine deaminase
MIVDVGSLDIFDTPSEIDDGYMKELVERWWCLGDDRCRKGVWIQGRRVL